MKSMDTKDPCAGEGELTEDDRRRIISRIHSLLYWVGKMIPEEVVIDNQVVDLRDVVFRYIEKENPTEEEIKGALALADVLSLRARQLEDEIKEEDLTRPQACDIMNEIRGLLRAVDELRVSKGEVAKLKREELMKKVDDARRWTKFIKQVRPD